MKTKTLKPRFTRHPDSRLHGYVATVPNGKSVEHIRSSAGEWDIFISNSGSFTSPPVPFSGASFATTRRAARVAFALISCEM